jgi:7-carboxy-7-deazaguanine synthase
MEEEKSGLYLIELYSSIQGETSFAGLPCSFIRLAGCNLRCTWCDTPHSFGRGEFQSFDSILHKLKEFGNKHLCVTGGEPLLQSNVIELMQQLCDQGYVVSLETGGSLSTAKVDPRVHIILDIKCPGSGMSHKNHWENLALLRPHDEIKFVVKDRTDYDFAKEVCSRYHLYAKGNHLLISPVHGLIDPKELVRWILNDHLPVRLNLQLHKYIWSPTTKGV